MPDTTPAPIDLAQLADTLSQRLTESGQGGALAQFNQYRAEAERLLSGAPTSAPAPSSDLIDAQFEIDRLGLHIREQDIQLSTQRDAMADLEGRFIKLQAQLAAATTPPAVPPVEPATPATPAVIVP